MIGDGRNQHGTWLILTLPTLTAMEVGGAKGDVSLLGWAGAGVVVAVSGFKAAAILRHFLGLRRASPGWRARLYVYLVVIGGLLFAAYGVDWRSFRDDTPPQDPRIATEGIRPSRADT
ncbi:cytochrome C oxidase subunit IV family protein [Microvirga splendida]|uniref:Cytochrome C oxidase subunit IV family protein n=1 Tax=Microvirga splendida TaxID=2795727 RepID=A0ABS0XZX7_9HYPH|nr:cytochrome C oxidase subunit IV family protein [Microvirga splendida]MBJ6125609.1 cytochrome C oxidase subunit IV family protein [Microvirga splendida]